MPESLFKPPPVTPFVECPNCKKLIEYGVEACSHCHEEIRPEYALASAYVVHRNTQACSHANTIKSAEKAAVIVLGASILGYVAGGSSLLSVNIGTSVLSVCVVLAWFLRYGRFKFGDEDFVKAKRDMRNSLLLWLALLFVQSLTIIYLLRAKS